MTRREDCMRIRHDILRADPRATFVFRVTIEEWERLHLECGSPFDPKEPFKLYSRFCGARVVIDTVTTYMKDT